MGFATNSVEPVRVVGAGNEDDDDDDQRADDPVSQLQEVRDQVPSASFSSILAGPGTVRCSAHVSS